MCWGDRTPTPSASGASSCPPGSTAPCPLQCPNMEIEINNTPATDDDYVQLKWEHPVKRHVVHCRIRVPTPSAQSTTVVITNPDGRLRFPNDGDTTTTVTVPADGSWASFDISGQTGSAAMNDAVIQAHCNTATGALLATKSVTVFWFDQAQIDVAIGGNYALTGGRYTPSPANAVDYSAQARIRPAGVNCAAPQVSSMRIGIVQNNTAAVHTVIWSNPVIAWNAGVAAGTQAAAPASVRRTRSLPAGVYNDSETHVAPLYDQPGQTSTLDPNSLKPPIGCANGAAATSSDAPSPTLPPLQLPVQNASGSVVGQASYTASTTTRDAFITYAVVFDTTSSELCALRQRTWDLNVDSTAATPQHATAAAADAAPVGAPVTAAPFGNDVINNPANQAITQAGTTNFTK